MIERGVQLEGLSHYVGLSIYKHLSHYSGSLGLPIFWWGLLIATLRGTVLCLVGI